MCCDADTERPVGTVTKGSKLTKVLARDDQKFRHATKFEALSKDEPDHVESPDINL